MKSTILAISFVVATLFLSVSSIWANVSPDGSFSYSVPIEIPAGTNGCQPNLSLSYNSSGTNGMVGVGWSLNGLSFVERDSSKGINYNGTDSFVSSSGPLMPVAGGYFAAEYDNLSRFELVGSIESGSEYWIEHRVDGGKNYYGLTPDSRIVADRHAPRIRTWALSRSEDKFGNYYTVTYTVDQGEYYPVTITYTMNDGGSLNKYRYVEFG
jgi:hypothetical protein